MPSDVGRPLEILCEDGPVLAVNKPAGLLTLGAKPGVPTLERHVKQFLKDKYDKPGNVYLGIPHRLDRPVSGVVVFARNSKAAARLAEQFRDRQVHKIYWALVERPPAAPAGELVNWLLKAPDQASVQIVPPETPGSRESRLRYRLLEPHSELQIPNSELAASPAASPPLSPPDEAGETPWALLEIEPLTGRTHQIRVQLAAHGCPIVGDGQYGATTRLTSTPAADPRDEPIALHARSLTILHPVRYDSLTITAPLPGRWRNM
ncbi:MAG TPA: RNA pseudouridine synthase [Planctomycetaceae bacterium]|jgi:23S rRNA pseudouridine1911/1915/1917 synthase